MRKYTKEELKKYWMARCPECGWKGLTIDCGGFGAIADTGDYSDGYCPKCSGSVEPDDESSKRIILWTFRFITFYKFRKNIKEWQWERKMDKMLYGEIKWK